MFNHQVVAIWKMLQTVDLPVASCRSHKVLTTDAVVTDLPTTPAPTPAGGGMGGMGGMSGCSETCWTCWKLHAFNGSFGFQWSRALRQNLCLIGKIVGRWEWKPKISGQGVESLLWCSCALFSVEVLSWTDIVPLLSLRQLKPHGLAGWNALEPVWNIYTVVYIFWFPKFRMPHKQGFPPKDLFSLRIFKSILTGTLQISFQMSQGIPTWYIIYIEEQLCHQ